MSVKINVRLPEDLYVTLDSTAAKTGLSVSAVLIDAMKRGLEMKPVQPGPHALIRFFCPWCKGKAVPCGRGWCIA